MKMSNKLRFLLPALLLIATGTASQLTMAADVAHYTAMGDSFSAGNGTENNDDSTCGRTKLSYPSLWNAKYHPKIFTYLACSGATTEDLETNQIKDLPADSNMVTVTIGGNDVGFGGAILMCLFLEPDGKDQPNKACTKELDDMAEAINGPTSHLHADLVKAYLAILKQAKSAKVYVLNYPHLFSPPPAPPGQIDSITDASRRQANDVVDKLSDAIKKAVQDANRQAQGVTTQDPLNTRTRLIFVDVRNNFKGHGVTGADGTKGDWINFMEGYPPPPITGILHPNATGHKDGYLPALEDAIAAHHRSGD
jgi:lysophospholipase L1-like esterase